MACQEYDPFVFEMVGNYDSVIVGDPNGFTLTVSSDYDDNILIEAPFDGSVWDIVEADVDCEACELKEIDIDRQDLSRDISIEGRGAYSFGTIQLDYTIWIGRDAFDYTIVGSLF